jgi:hypothetical protein
MLESIKRFFAGGAAPAADWSDVAQWAQQRGLGFKRAREGEGFVVDGAMDGMPWRMEWGPSQRTYIEARELRIRMELMLPSDMQMLVLSRPLMEALERQVFESFTEGAQTQIDTATPEEMRWLVMFPKVNLNSLPALRSALGVVASAPATGLSWLEGPLAAHLERALSQWLQSSRPFVLMTLRGRTYLRMALVDPDVRDLEGALSLFETAVQQAMRLAVSHGESGADWPSTGTTAWQNYENDPPPGR